jgi:hypothetical protein
MADDDAVCLDGELAGLCGAGGCVEREVMGSGTSEHFFLRWLVVFSAGECVRIYTEGGGGRRWSETC